MRDMESLKEYLRGGDGPTGKYQRLMWCYLLEMKRKRLDEFVEYGVPSLRRLLR